MVNCAGITDERECKIHNDCTCEWENGNCLVSMSLPYDELKCNKLLIPKIYELLDNLVNTKNKHSPDYNKYADSLNNYITSLNSEEINKIFIKLRDMAHEAIDQLGLKHIKTKYISAKLKLFMDTAKIELAKLGGVLKKRKTNKHRTNKKSRTNKHRTNKKSRTNKHKYKKRKSIRVSK